MMSFANNLKLKRSKCEFLKTEVEFLGFTVSGKGLAPNNKKVEVINNHPAPKDRRELKAFLGLANYYRKFIENFLCNFCTTYSFCSSFLFHGIQAGT